MAQSKTTEILILIFLVIITVLLSVILFNQYKAPQVINGKFEDEKGYGGYGKLHTVTKVIDGDTIVIEDGEHLRLICIDTPERGEEYYIQAKDYLNKLILGKEVLIENDVSDRDKYNRLLGYIYLDGEFVNEAIVRDGWARAYPYYPDTTLCPQIEEAQAKAQEEKIGMWQDYEMPEFSGEYVCDSNFYNCADFSTRAEAQAVYEACGGIGNDIHRLDSDGDGKACESVS